MGTILLIIGITIVYVFFAVVYYIIMDRIFIYDNGLAVATCWVWPIAGIILALVVLGIFFYALLTGKFKQK